MVIIDITPYCGTSDIRDIEILACKILQHKDKKIVLDLKHEGWDIVENGIEQKVKNICNELSIPYDQIEFTSSDNLCKSKTFKHTINPKYTTFFSDLYKETKTVPSDKFNYGLFCGRATNERLYSFWKHKNWHHSNRGLASMHLDISTSNEWKSDYTGFICEYNECWNSLVPQLPYSDIDSYIKPPIIFGNYKDVDLWKRVYSELMIEVVVETNQTPDTFFITEKTFRPIGYGKLFLVIGSPEFEKNLKNLGFDIFDDIIDKSYDTESSYYRVDAVFKSLDRLLRNPINIQALMPRLQANKRVLENL